MGFITDIIKGLPIAAVQEEKIATFEKKFAQLEIENLQLRAENECLKKAAEEEERVHEAITFKRGRRTGGKWAAFCSSCSKPARGDTLGAEYIVFCTARCGWRARPSFRLEDADKILA